MGSKFPTPAPTDPELRKPPAPKGPPPMDQITSLQRELAEARNALGTEQEMHNAWRKRGEEAESDVETCRSLAKRLYAWVERSPEMTSEYDEVRQVKDDARKILFAPAPSDVKGEEPSVSDTNGCGKRIESDTKLTPLTDPSVRGVLVDDGEPTYDTEDSVLYWSAGELMQGIGYAYGSLVKWQPVTLRPASEFGVATRGEPGLKKLPDKVHVWEETGEVRHVTCGEFYMWPDCEDIFHLVALRSTRPCKVMRKLDPALYAIPDGGERGDTETVEYWSGIVADKNQRIEELETENRRILRDQEVEDAYISELQSDAERLRKAIETHRLEWGAGRVIESNNRLWSALSPSPAAASGDWLNKMADAEDAAGDISIGTFAPAAESDKPYGLVEQMDAGEGTVYGRRMTVEMRKEPAAGTQGNPQHHIEGAKIPEGGSGSPAEDSEVPTTRKREPRTYKEELERRLAVCEERCRELEAGIRAHKEETIRALTTTGNRVPWRGDLDLWSLLSPKAGGEYAVL